MSKIKVLDFDEYPGLRHCSVSEFSGEEYYHKILNDAFKKAYENKEGLIVELDGTDAYASSFLDEAFGNLVYDFTLANVSRLIKIISNDEPHWTKMLQEKTFKEWETRRKNNEKPIVTELHGPWFRLVDGEIKKEVWETP
ncbi:STAS-like domain-containing protein [Flavobacterium sp. XS2P39]|uniref:STAS-like domain-containing protein n=1 Tax=Flavobacterium sp. XS2P39 TaxID=3401725 RepID=UPI003AADD7EE